MSTRIQIWTTTQTSVHEGWCKGIKPMGLPQHIITTEKPYELESALRHINESGKHFFIQGKCQGCEATLTKWLEMPLFDKLVGRQRLPFFEV